jgi:hypothetical protein
MLVLQQPTQRGDHGAGLADTVPAGQVGRPQGHTQVGRLVQPPDQVSPCTKPVGVTLPVAPAHAEPGMTANLATHRAPRRRLRSLAGGVSRGRTIRFARAGTRACVSSRVLAPAVVMNLGPRACSLHTDGEDGADYDAGVVAVLLAEAQDHVRTPSDRCWSRDRRVLG